MSTIPPGSPFAESPKRAASWQLRTRTLALPRQPLVMGILNVTPDSFSDGGRFVDPQAAIAAGLALAAAGADLIDVGGESTRPYAEAVREAEELRRVLPIVQALAEQLDVPVSIDTSKAAVAREALAAGAEIINDITALASDPEMLSLAVASRCGVCVMHMQGTPQTMQDAPHYDDVVAEVFAWLAARRDACLAAGIEPGRLALDPGIGFGKTHGHNLQLLAGAWRFHALGCPLVVGHSRKGYIGKVLGDKLADRTAGTIGVSISLALQGVQILRVHDVLAVRQALELFAASGGLSGRALELP
jgi:dihydropteroate synthase